MLSALKGEGPLSSPTPVQRHCVMSTHAFCCYCCKIIYLTEDRSLFFCLLIPSRFGPPFLMREDRSISWDQLQQSILSKLYYLMINGAQAQVFFFLSFFLKQLKFMCLFILANIHSNPYFSTLRMGSCIHRNFY